MSVFSRLEPPVEVETGFLVLGVRCIEVIMNHVHGIVSNVPDRIYLPAGGNYNPESIDDGVPAEQEIEKLVKYLLKLYNRI